MYVDSFRCARRCLVVSMMAAVGLGGCVEDPPRVSIDPVRPSVDARASDAAVGLDAALDAVPDMAPDPVPDTVPDMAPDAGPDAVLDAAPDAAPPIPDDCVTDGNWLVTYDSPDPFMYRYPDILSIEGGVVTLTSAGDTDVFSDAPCAPPHLDYRWEGPCVLRLTHRTGPCGDFERQTAMLGQVVLDEAVPTRAHAADWFGHEPPPPFERFTARASRLLPGPLCSAVARQALPGHLRLPHDDAPYRWSGDVEVVEIRPDGAGVMVRVQGADDFESRFTLPVAPPDLELGTSLWLDAERPALSALYDALAYIVRRGEGGPLIAGYLGGDRTLLTDGPWARAGITLSAAPICAPSWEPHPCSLSALQAITVDGSGERGVPGETIDIVRGEPLRLIVSYADLTYARRCSEVLDEHFGLGLLPAAP